MRWLIRHYSYIEKVLSFGAWGVGVWAPAKGWLMGWPVEWVAVLFVAGIGTAAYATLGLFHLGDYLEQKGEGSEEGERVAKVLEGMKLAGLHEIDAKSIVGIWYADQPSNESLRLATKTGMYARLREGVRLGWLGCPDFPAHEVRRNFLVSLDSAVQFFRLRRWLEINPE